MEYLLTMLATVIIWELLKLIPVDTMGNGRQALEIHWLNERCESSGRPLMSIALPRGKAVITESKGFTTYRIDMRQACLNSFIKDLIAVSGEMTAIKLYSEMDESEREQLRIS